MKSRHFVRCLLSSLLGGGTVANAITEEALDLTAGDISLERVFSGVALDSPVVFTTAPGDDRHYYVALQDGRVLALDRVSSGATLFLDIRDRVDQGGGEKGLLGLAFDPDYESNGNFYVNYTSNGSPMFSVVARFHHPGGTGSADAGSERKLLSFQQPYENHNGGWVGIGPDRKLYIGSGDGGSGGDPQNNGQRLDTVLGKILRIERDGTIPSDNPFVGHSGARGEIWAYGLRNPYRASFDLVTGRLWAGDVGQSLREEIDLIRRGGNYGWRVYEGTLPYNNPNDLPASQFVAPVHEYSHSYGCAVVGGVVYHGSAIPELQGRYVYSDYCSGTLWALEEADGREVSNTVIGNVSGSPSSIGEDQDGELHVTTLGGAIYRISRGDGSSGGFAPRLSDTGLFLDTAALTPSPALIPYGIRAQFWSDRARKQRWFKLPPGGRIRFEPLTAWRLPVGSATVKHFEITLADGSTRRLETRVFRHTPDGWRGASYRWNRSQTDALLVTSTRYAELEVLSNGKTVKQRYEFPSQAACLRCHTEAAGFVLGLNTPQMNRRFDGRNQLGAFEKAGLFAQDIGVSGDYRKLPDPFDDSQPLAARARSWLHVNCSQCHRPGGPTGVDMDLRWLTPIEDTHTRGVAPSGDDLGISGAKRIAPGLPSKSLVYARMRRLDSTRMPPVGSHVISKRGAQLLERWIDEGAN